MIDLSLAEARRLALAAQGFGQTRDGAATPLPQLLRTINRLGVIQIDSVNVLVRSHYLPLYSRLGPYDRTLLDRAAYAGRRRSLFEYWGHEASLLPVGLQPLFRWRMARAARGVGLYGMLARWARRQRAFVESVLAEVRERGPISAAELTQAGRSRGPWWGWSNGKRALEFLFWAGQVTTATRRSFERVYDVPERALPARVLARPTPPEDEAQRELLMIAAHALGVATARDLREYFRLHVADARARIAELVEAGRLVPARVEGWKAVAYVDRAARVPATMDARALLSPFDSLVFERERTERLFGFRYRIALYTPVHLRTHGYYVLPFLLGDRLVARVDLKADRQAGILRVPHAQAEPGVDRRRVRAALRDELELMRTWLRVERAEPVRLG